MAGPIDLDWRNEAEYDYVDRLTHEQYGFECLRRNADYADAYRRMKGEADAGRTAEAERLAASWGLRFRRRPRPSRRPCYNRMAPPPQPAPCASDGRIADAY